MKKNYDTYKREGLPPSGWRPLNATTNPIGWEWWCNGKSRFGGEYENALFRIFKP